LIIPQSAINNDQTHNTHNTPKTSTLPTHRLPFYSLAKLGFLAALWHPSTKLAASIYVKGLAPLLARCGWLI
jgi:hypothetical protein